MCSPKLTKLALFLSCVLYVGSALPAWTQATDTGTIAGTVIDPSGAVVPGTKVTLADTATSRSQTTVTNDAGRYILVNVTPGKYDMTFEKQGFSTTKAPGQQVRVGLTTTVNISLLVGGTTTMVEVSAASVELQTTNATIGNEITGVALSSLPSLGRDVSTFITLQPGVSPDGSVAGAVVDQSSFMLDGGNNTNDMDGSMQVYTPSFAGDPTGGLIANPNGNFAASGPTGVMPTPADSVEEFKVGTTNQTADFNNSSGMQVNVVTKRGTSAWHGTAYEYYLDNNFSGNTWDNNNANVPIPSYHYNRFGAAAGGPITNKEILGGKTYIFANYQGFRWPNSETINRVVPSNNMRNGIITDTSTGTQYDLNTLDPRGIGINSLVQQMWNKYMPEGNDPSCGPNSGSRCDGVNTIGFKANMAVPQKDNFGVVRLDHDFGPKWKFNTSYRYYHLTRATHDQIDIGGFFPGDKLGVPSALSNRPQVPWYLVLGLTTTISPNVTNDFHYSFLRNWWAWGTAGAPPQLAGLGGALEPFGEQRYQVLAPYNVNTQQTRTRFWDGKDHFFRDDVSMLKGNHILQFGGQYQHNFNYHQRTDNGGGINYYTVYQLGDGSGAGLIDMTGLPAAIANSTSYSRYSAAILGLVTDSQVAYTRSGANLSLNPPLTPAFDKSTIPYYNVYFSDTWHVKPSLTLTYGMGYTLEMPPVEEAGKQVELVDASAQPVEIEAYLKQRKSAALQGQVFNPILGYALVGNTAEGLKYPYNPYYGSFSPRIAVAWNPDLGGRKDTVIRGGYGRIYGRLNGVDLVLVPLLGTGLIQPVQCRLALSNGTCGPNTPDLNTAFRIGTDGMTAPLPAASPTLPQPLYPGINNVSAAAGEALDPHFRPNSVDSFDLTVQHQFGRKITMEVGAISRWIHNEYQPINTNAVPYMMTLGGQQFSAAYAAVETALGCATSANDCGAGIPAANLSNGNPNPAYTTYFNSTFGKGQPFLETALAPTGYCNASYAGIAYTNCTAALAGQQASNLVTQKVWDLWSSLDNGGGAGSMGWNFPRSMLNSPIPGSAPCPGSADPTPCGANGQISGGVGVNASIGHGNYNAGFITVKMNDWHGVTAQNNFTWSKALGTGAFVQATSAYTANDPFNLDNMYGVQAYDRTFVWTSFVVYQPPFYRGQQGLKGHLLGGWTFAPVFAAGSGAPLWCNTNTGGGYLSGAGGQDFGSADGQNFQTNANCLQTKSYTGGNSVHYTKQPDGSTAANLFSNSAAVYANVRPPILGIDNRAGGTGQFRGLPYWNLDLSIKKNVKITESVNAEAQIVFTNVLNHNQLLDPILDITSPDTFGAITTQGNVPRTMEFGIRLNF